jgi:hypothetical protein
MMSPAPGRASAWLLVAVLAFSAAAPGLAHAWSNGGYSADESNPDFGTHDWIADVALRAIGPNASFLSVEHRTQFLLGTEAPDNPDYIGDYFNHHVYYYSSGSVQDDAAAVRAQAMLDDAVSNLEAGMDSDAAFAAGAMVHYISDMGVFGHTMGSETDWGSEEHHSDYEDQVEFLIDTLGEKDIPGLAASSARDAALSLAMDTTFGEGDTKPNIWMDANYDWDDPVFVASATSSLYASVAASASAILSFLDELPEEPADDPADDQVPDEETDGTADGGTWSDRLIYIVGAVAATTVAVVVLLARRMSR